MGNHDSWCFCKTGDDGELITCESCIQDERTKEIEREQEALKEAWAAKRRMDQFMKDLEDPEFYSRVCQRLGIHAGMSR